LYTFKQGIERISLVNETIRYIK